MDRRAHGPRPRGRGVSRRVVVGHRVVEEERVDPVVAPSLVVGEVDALLVDVGAALDPAARLPILVGAAARVSAAAATVDVAALGPRGCAVVGLLADLGGVGCGVHGWWGELVGWGWVGLGGGG